MLALCACCCCLWGYVEQLEASLLPAPSLPLGCDSSSIWVRRPGRDAALWVIASEMNYLVASETEGGKEIVIELPSRRFIPPASPSCLKLLHLQCRETFSICTNSHTHTKPISPLPHTHWPLQHTILMWGDFRDWLLTGTYILCLFRLPCSRNSPVLNTH